MSILAEKANSLIAEIAFSADGVFSGLRRLSFLFRKNSYVKRSLVVTGKWNAERSSIPYRCRCGLMWKGLDWCEYPDWFIGGGREAWLLERFWRQISQS
ncbi:hypothetical protein TNCV_4214741 [Trichonephila clavipes]|nr:hypothetical protein TNCV_4214741 [Trichonephila clavipes]